MAKLTDPDSLNQATEVVISTGGKTIQLLVAGNLDNTSPGSTSGVTLQCVYSFLKEEWKTDATLNKFKFPLKMFTKTDGQLQNGWDWADATTRNLLRDCGWTETNGDEYAGLISLGNHDATTDQSYFAQVTGFDQTATNFNKTGNLNESIKFGTTPDYSGYLKMYLREQGKLYDSYNLLSEQGIAALEPVLYRFPLSNSTDIKITDTDLTIDTTTPYVGTSELNNTDGSVTAASPTLNSATGGFVAGDVGKLITIASGTNTGQYEIVTYTDGNNVDVDRNFANTESSIDFHKRPYGIKFNHLKGSGFTTWANSTVYAAGDVVQELTGSPKRWFFTAAGGTSSGTDVQDDTGVTDWAAYDGEEQIGSNWYAFNRTIDCNGATDRQVYDWMMRQLRRVDFDINVNDNATANQGSFGTVKGNLAVDLGQYVGDTLKPNPGVVLRGFDTNSTNSIVHSDVTVDGGGIDAESKPVTTTERSFPFVAAGNLVFSQNLVDETDADTKYTMYFTTNPAGNFDTANAVIVDNNAGSDITGEITAGSIAFDFDYTNNTQGGRTADTDADVTIVAQGLPGATWVAATGTITKATGITFNVNADDERNYQNPA